VWAAGFGGTILHYDGVQWTPYPSGTSAPFYSLRALPGGEIWVTEPFSAHHLAGGNWTEYKRPYQVGGTLPLSNGDVLVFGLGATVERWNGSTFTLEHGAGDGTGYGTPFGVEGETWVVGQGPSALHHDGKSW